MFNDDELKNFYLASDDYKENIEKKLDKNFELISQIKIVIINTLRAISDNRQSVNSEIFELVNMTISVRNLRFIIASFDESLKGFSEIGLSLGRLIYEHNLFLEYSLKFPLEMKDWPINPKKMLPSLMRKKLGKKKDLYNALSNNYIHLGSGYFFSEVIHPIEKNKIEFFLDPELLEDDHITIYIIMILAMKFLKLLRDLFKDDLDKNTSLEIEYFTLKKNFLIKMKKERNTIMKD